MTTPVTPQAESRLPHRLAVLLVAVTFPLIWVGGMVTTYKAGMAVPDWPSTYGYNLLLYPWQTWLFGPFDLMVEHGHRLLGAASGMITIALLVSLWWKDPRRWMTGYGVLLLVAVIGQGLLGGARVIQDERQLAMIHGCTGPVFFAMTVAAAVFTSRSWRDAARRADRPAAGRLQRLAVFTLGLSYIQLVIGAQLRHMPPGIDVQAFRLALMFHLFVAGMILLHAVFLALRARRHYADTPAVVRPANILLGIVLAQICLGVGTWITNYGWPVFVDRFGWGTSYVILAEGMTQSLITTAHVATGSLILGMATVVVLRSYRLFRSVATTGVQLPTVGSLETYA